jgi:SAM-dependent MidA family methyltransferase
MHRLGWDAKGQVWFEWGVASQAGRFVWTRMTDAQPGDGNPKLPFCLSHLPLPVEHKLLEVLPDGFTIEWCPSAEQWWGAAASVLERGKLLAIDYGLTADELFVPDRRDGTVRGYRRHRPSHDVLAYPGEQDLTAHVNFTAIRAAGETAGLRTDAFLTQAQFLTGIAARTWTREDSFGEWTPERTRQFKTLTHPEHLGRPFRVLVQSRGD